MKKLLLSFLAFALLFTASCARAEPNPPEKGGTEGDNTAFPYTFTDSTGTTVTLEEKPQKTAVLFSSYADIWVTAGGTVDITVGESVERGFAGDGAVLVDSGAGHTSIDLEALTAAAPDLVIGTADFPAQTDAVAFCRSAGIPAASFRVESFDDYLEVLSVFCHITGETERYREYGTAIREQIQAILDKTAAYADEAEHTPEILFVRSGTSAKSTKAKTAADNFVCVMLDELGTHNIADSASALTGSLSLEAILENDPDALFIATMGSEEAAKSYMDSLLSSDGWKELRCVRQGSYCYLPKDLFHFKPNARWAQAYRFLAEFLYPEIDFE